MRLACLPVHFLRLVSAQCADEEMDGEIGSRWITMVMTRLLLLLCVFCCSARKYAMLFVCPAAKCSRLRSAAKVKIIAYF